MIQNADVGKNVYNSTSNERVSQFQFKTPDVGNVIGKNTEYMMKSSFSLMLKNEASSMGNSISNNSSEYTSQYTSQYAVGQKNQQNGTDYSIGTHKNEIVQQSQKDTYTASTTGPSGAPAKSRDTNSAVQNNSSEVSSSHTKHDEKNTKKVKADSEQKNVKTKSDKKDKKVEIDDVKHKVGKKIIDENNSINNVTLHTVGEELQKIANDEEKSTQNNKTLFSGKETSITDTVLAHTIRSDEKEILLDPKAKTNTSRVSDKVLVQVNEGFQNSGKNFQKASENFQKTDESSQKENKDNMSGVQILKDGLFKNIQSLSEQDVSAKQTNTHTVKNEGNTVSLDKTNNVGENSHTTSNTGFFNDLQQKVQNVGKNEILTQKVFSQLQKGGNDTLVQQAKLVLQDGGRGQIRLQLTPKELGEVKLIVQLDSNNTVHAKAVVTSDQARDAMQKNLDNFAKEFQQEGYNLGSFSVSVDSNSSKFDFEKQEENMAHREKEYALGDGFIHRDVQSYIRISNEVNFVM